MEKPKPIDDPVKSPQAAEMRGHIRALLKLIEANRDWLTSVSHPQQTRRLKERLKDFSSGLSTYSLD